MLEEIIKNNKKRAFNVAVGWFITSIMVVAFITFSIVMIEYAIPSKNIKLITILGISYFILNIFRGIVTLFEDLNDYEFVKELEANYREKIFIKLQKAKQNKIEKIKVGEILENIINDTKEVAKWYGTGICMPYFGGVVRLVGTLMVLMYLNIPIITIIFLIYILGFIVTHVFNKKSIEYTKLKREANAKILNWSNEQVQGYSTIKALQVEQQRVLEIKQLISKYEKVTNKLEKNIRMYNLLYNIIVSFAGVINILIRVYGTRAGDYNIWSYYYNCKICIFSRNLC